MKKGLLIAEKTSEMNIIMDVYNKHKSEFPFSLDALSQAGHLLTLKKPNEIDEKYGKWCWEHLPFHPEKNGGWAYKMITGTKPPASLAKSKYQKIKDAIKSGDYDFIVHAGDADQEGQLLVDIVLQSLKVKLPIKRHWSNDTTEPGVLKALNSLIDYSDDWQQNLLKAAYARQHSDYRFGIQEHIDLGIKYDPNTGIYGMDFFTVLARKGKRVAQRKRQHARLGNFQKVNKEEAQKWFTEKLGGTLI